MNPIYRCQYLFHHWWWWWTVFVVWLTSRNCCQRSWLLQIFGTTEVGFEPAQNISSNFVEWSCAILITTRPWHDQSLHIFFCWSYNQVGHIVLFITPIVHNRLSWFNGRKEFLECWDLHKFVQIALFQRVNKLSNLQIIVIKFDWMCTTNNNFTMKTKQLL